MKANELMIGDWVKFNNSDIVHQIKAIAGKSVKVDKVYWYSASKLSPIPITSEILAKNGFYYGYTSSEEDLASNTIAQLSEEDKGWVWDEGNGEIKVMFPNESDGGMITIDDQGFDRRMAFIFAENIYVHELQHAMRLCGIEKEIEL